MSHHCILKNGVVYMPTVAKTEAGYYMDVEPVAVVPVTDTEPLHRALADTIARGHPIVPTPTRNNFPRPVVLKYAGVRNWTAFHRGAEAWSMDEISGHYQIVPYRADGDGWKGDRDRKIAFAVGTSIDEVIDRMIAILQDAAKQ